MDVRELEWFVRLAEDENVTRVAEELHMTQSTLSRAVARVEGHFGVRLFDRHGRRLELNRYGEAVARHARNVLEELRAAYADLGEMADPASGTIRLGYVPWLGTWLVPQLLGAYRRDAPKVDFTLSSGTMQMLCNELRRGVVELVLASGVPIGEGITSEMLLDIPLVLAVSRDHRLAERESVSMSELRDESFVLPGAHSELRRLIESACHQHGFTPRVVFESSHAHPDTIRGFVAAGLGVAIRPSTYAAVDIGVSYVALADAVLKRVVGLAWREDCGLSTVAARFKDFMISTAPLLDGRHDVEPSGRDDGPGDWRETARSAAGAGDREATATP